MGYWLWSMYSNHAYFKSGSLRILQWFIPRELMSQHLQCTIDSKGFHKWILILNLYCTLGLVTVSIAAINYYNQDVSWRGKKLFSLYLNLTVHNRRNSGQEIKQAVCWSPQKWLHPILTQVRELELFIAPPRIKTGCVA